MKYCVGIPVRNEEKTIQTTLQSILSQNDKPDTIYVCLNGNTDSTQEKIEELENSNIKILKSEPGKPNAWNTIVSRAKEDGFSKAIFTDGDVKMHKPDTTQTLLLPLGNGIQLVGGNFYRLPPKEETWHTKHCDMKEGYGTYSSFGRKTPGGLYGINLESINRRLQEFNGEMPSEIIREDLFLSLIYNSTTPSFLSAPAYIEVPPITNFKDWRNMVLRQSRGLVQILEDYFQIIPNDWKFDEFNIRETNRYSQIRRGLLKKAIKEGSSNLSNLWEETTSTKVA